MADLSPGIFDISTASDLVDLSIQDKWLKTPGSEQMNNFRKFCNVRTGNPDYTIGLSKDSTNQSIWLNLLSSLK